MPDFQHGKDTAVLVDDADLSAYFNQVNATRQIQAVNTTTFTNSGAKAYLAGVESGSIAIQGLYDGSAAAIDEILDTAIGAESIITVGINGISTIGDRVVMLKGENVSYQLRGTTEDAVRINVGGTADGGVRTAGVVLQPLEAETAVLNGTSHDGLASSAFGGVGHLHVTAFTGTTGTVKIQDSSDDVNFSDLIEFDAVTGTTAQRKLVTGNVDQYLRFAITADTFTTMTVFCSFARNRR